MKPALRAAIVVAVGLSLLGLEGCGALRKVAGTAKNPPDEFAVVSRPPLILPPDFTLKPPAPDEKKPRELTPSVETLRLLFPENYNVAPQASPGETALLHTIGAQAQADARSTAGDFDTEIIEKGSVLEDIFAIDEREGTLDGSSIRHVGSSEVVPESSKPGKD
jgi:Protein of unknown function (DUF3035)